MPRIAHWRPPLDEDVTEIVILRGVSMLGPFNTQVARVSARDGYDNWITHWVDDAQDSDAWYVAQFLKPEVTASPSLEKVASDIPRQGLVPQAVSIQDVLDTIQGLPLSRVSAYLVYQRIKWTLGWLETRSRMKFTTQQIVDEVYDHGHFKKIVGRQTGSRFRLRHFPVRSVERIRYRVRGASSDTPILFEDLDIQIVNNDVATGYNRGEITIWPKRTSIQSVFSGLTLTDHYWDRAIDVLVDYTHGWAQLPADVEQMVVEIAAADVMEIAGEADTAGISSRSIDGYSESFTASATTTIFSARRIYYQDKAKQLLKHYRKPLWGASGR